MNRLKRIFKREIVYVIKCEQIIKKPRKGEMFILKFPQTISPRNMIKIGKEFEKMLGSKEDILAISGIDLAVGRIRMEEKK